MSEHVYYSEPSEIPYRIPDFTHITQTIAGNTLVTEQPQYSSTLASPRKTQINANGLICNDLHGNQRNNFYIPNSLDFLWNSNVRKRPFSIRSDPKTRGGLLKSGTKIRKFGDSAKRKRHLFCENHTLNNKRGEKRKNRCKSGDLRNFEKQ